ncbi:MAG: hypothetical protein R3284_12210, partial [Rubricoccaceae bacterium]|nr:hypothetical protein [Rubricoccaceae bacterium]
KIVVASTYLEQAEELGKSLADMLQEHVEPSTVLSLDRHQDADIIITLLPQFQLAMQYVPDAEIVGVTLQPPYEVLEKVAHLSAGDTVGVVVQDKDAVTAIADEIRLLAGFQGQVVSIPIETESRRLEMLIRQVDLVLYTPQVRRRLRPVLKDHPSAILEPKLTTEAANQVRLVAGR